MHWLCVCVLYACAHVFICALCILNYIAFEPRFNWISSLTLEIFAWDLQITHFTHREKEMNWRPRKQTTTTTTTCKTRVLTIAIYDLARVSITNTMCIKWNEFHRDTLKSSKDFCLVIVYPVKKKETEMGFHHFICTRVSDSNSFSAYNIFQRTCDERFSSFDYDNSDDDDKILTFHMVYYGTHFILWKAYFIEFTNFTFDSHVSQHKQQNGKVRKDQHCHILHV